MRKKNLPLVGAVVFGFITFTGFQYFSAVSAQNLTLNIPANVVAPLYPPSEILTRQRAMPTLPFPNYLSPITDPTYGTKIVRITDQNTFGRSDNVLKHFYSKNQPWNADGSLIMLGGSYPAPILDGRTFQYLRSIHQPSNAVWSNTEPNFAYGTYSNTNNFVKADMRTDWTSQIVKTFDEYNRIDFGASEGNLSNDDRYAAIFGFKNINGRENVSVFVFDILQRQKVSELTYNTPLTINGDINNCTMSQSGNYVLIQYITNRHGREAGIEVYDRNLNFLRRLSNTGGGHYDAGYDANGNEVIVVQGDSTSALVSVRLDNGQVTQQLSNSLMGYPIHISCRNLNRPGWCYVSEFAFENRDQTPYINKANHQELLAVKLDGSGTVEHFGQEQHAVYINQSEYERSAFGVPNRDGSLVMWASDWNNASNPARVHTYVAGMFQSAPISTNGLNAVYYDNIDFSGSTVTRTDPTIDFSWENNPPAAGIGNDYYSVRWTGQIEPRYSENYTFSTVSDDGVRLYINNQLIINNWTNHGDTEDFGTITLQAGQKYDIRLEYYEAYSYATAKLSWQSPSQAKEIIPAARLYSNQTTRVAGRILYVAPDGNDANDGLSEQTAIQTLGSATGRTEPGDTVLVKNGTYTTPDFRNVPAYIFKSGRPDAWITFKNFPGHRPKIKSRNITAIRVVGASYIIIEGFDVEGSRDEVTMEEARRVLCDDGNSSETAAKAQGSGIEIVSDYDNPNIHSHHIIIRNNEVYRFGASGIGSASADYLTIENNVVYENGFYNPYGTSGISLYQQYNQDTPPAGQEGTIVKNIIRGNISYGNANKFGTVITADEPCDQTPGITDGNGIIIDDFQNTQRSGYQTTKYLGRTLIENNVLYGNGGRGINVFSSNYVDVVNNTAYQNGQSTESNSFIDSDVSSFWCKDVRFFNNIIFARPDRKINLVGFRPGEEGDRATIRYDNNLVFGGIGFDPASGGNNTTGQNPLFVNEAVKDFSLAESSPAIDRGAATLNDLRSPLFDILGTARPQRSGFDIGAYEKNDDAAISGVYKITAQHSGKVLDVSQISTADGAIIHQWQYLGQTNQKWRVERQTDGTYRFTAQHSGKVMDAQYAGTTAGTRVWQYTWNNSCAQKWRIEARSDGAKTIRSSCSDKVLDVSGYGLENGAAFQLWNYIPDIGNQAFVFERLGN
jgi:parallel beta-helix repeat protein